MRLRQRWLAILRETVRALDASRPVNTIRTLNDVIDAALGPRRLALQVIGAFAMIALVLAAVGVYGVANHSAQQRTKEIGLRIALGAQATDIIALVIYRNLILTVIGVGAGLAGSIAFRQVIEAYLFAVASTDVHTLLIVSALLGGVALTASYLPIRHALRVGPVRALQSETR